MNDRSLIRGVITATVYEPDGLPKRRRGLTPSTILRIIMQARFRFEEMFRMLRYEVSINHNVVTREGDAMIADLLSETPSRVKVSNATGHIQVGTGWTGAKPRENEVCNVPVGTPSPMDPTFPRLKGVWGSVDDNVTQYRSTFAAGTLNVTGIDEAALLNSSDPSSADCLVYAQIIPALTVTPVNPIQIYWEISIVGLCGHE